ncbi:DUF3488 and DUF4129 domain-containing transglutaminase family protein [Spirulina sp. CCNP1310]|uniref:transglutaminase TgpA family protein n=1 Tax=Spirulina sp. CCNP1310 TaxID=3110249 RepID=UPI002B1EB7DE|nr:DUF3488 and DUF4129 domain-containing transglutaminase family protein [Spirulina sp. CCNP1310]MEA5418852.1 DUF3488 and DUF4129 domain-containing transglutaminase family protein [Spirulina sp. CCNP1310]
MNHPPLKRLPFLSSLWTRLANTPLPVTEESIALRIWVQVLVVIGIMATDVGASTQMSVWAIPFSFVGTFWSWQRRKHRNITAKFLIAIGMLAALAYFFGNLLANINDTRLVLAELLIQLQVLHSFDLPRRQDLGYSMVIGLILLGVAGTLNETLAFGPFVIVFLAVALPILCLDYRSRLGFAPVDRRRTPASQERSPLLPLRLPQLGLFFGITLILGLVVFALMPRFPGYQLQTLPVSTSEAFEYERFGDGNRGIINPGQGETDASGGENGEAEAGEAMIYYGFNREINQLQNSSGVKEQEPKVLMRVRSQAPGFWRVLSFDHYTGEGWEISRDEQLTTINRPAWSYRFYVTPPDPPMISRQVIQTFTITAPMPNLIPALSHPSTLYFPTPEIALDPEGSMRAPIPLAADLTYTVISNVPDRDRTALGKAGTDYRAAIAKYYLEIDPDLAKFLRAEAEAMLASTPNPRRNPYEIALFLAQELKQRYVIATDYPIFPGDDVVRAFLRNGGGYPDHFSTVLTMMLRSLGIPARLTAGFGSGQFNPFTGFYLVRNTDAFVLTEVYFPQHGWYSFDPMPGHDLYPVSVEDYEAFGVLRQFWDWVAGWLPSPVTAAFAMVWGAIATFLGQAIERFWAFISGSAIGFLLGTSGAIACGLLAWLGWQRLRGWVMVYRWRRLPPMERIYRQMVWMLTMVGERRAIKIRKHRYQTPQEYADGLRSAIAHPSHYDLATMAIVDAITAAYGQWRYGDQTPDLATLEAQLHQLRRLTRPQPRRKTPV